MVSSGMEIEASRAMKRARSLTNSAFPGHGQRRFEHRLIVPTIAPRFTVGKRTRCFTIGSCFSRNIEETLEHWGTILPTRGFKSPKSEWPWRSNGLLNEYNPGSIAQRVVHALRGEPMSVDTLADTPRGVLDLLLPSPHHAEGVSRARALVRRQEIHKVYAQLRGSSLVIITLGMVEAWFDTHTALFLNRKPPSTLVESNPGRYVFRRMTGAEVSRELERTVAALIDAGIERILISVSPVPFNTTFSGIDAYTANLYSKSVLRVCAEELLHHPQVDYCPSYEMVISGGPEVFEEDNIHVKNGVVRHVVETMLEVYFSSTEQVIPD